MVAQVAEKHNDNCPKNGQLTSPTNPSTTTTRLRPLSVQAERIPDDLKSLKQWVLWRYEQRDGEPTKVPYRPDNFMEQYAEPGHKRAKTNDPRTWSSFRLALQVYLACQTIVDGIALCLQHDRFPLVGIDLDKCRDPETGVIEKWAMAIIRAINSYTEISPSGRGVRIFARGELPPEGRRRGRFEMYTAARLLTVTGHHVPGTPTTVEDRREVIAALHQRIFGAPETKKANVAKPTSAAPPPPASLALEDQAILDLAETAKNGEKFKKLWLGDCGDYNGDHSAADQALCSILAFYTKDEAQIDRMFRASGLYRPKWDRADYRERTIHYALNRITTHYKPNTEAVMLAQMGEQACAVCRGWDAGAEMLEENAPDAQPAEPLVDLALYNATVDEELPRVKDAVPRRRRRGLKPVELANLPPMKWQVEKHIPENSLAVLVGPSGVGKSFVALDLALCVATGRPFMDNYQVKPGPVVFIAAEGSGGMGKRVKAWMKHHGVTGWPDNIIFICDSFNLQDESEVEEILKIAEEDLGELPGLFVLDTLNRLFGAGNENDQRDMTTFINNVDRLRRPSNATALIVHHTGKDISRGARGSSVLRPAADTMILLEETDRGNGCLVVCDKQKDFEEFETYKLSKKKVEVDDETSLVFVGSEQWSTRYQLLTKTHKELLHTIKATFDTNLFGWTGAYKVSGLKSKDTFTKAIKELTLRSFLLPDDGQYRLNPDAVGVVMVSLAG